MKKTLFLIIALILTFSISIAQKKNLKKDTTQPEIKLPSVVKMGQPVYPEADIMAKTEGKIFLKVSVDEEGKIENIELAKQEGGSDEMVKSAIEAAKKIIFKPGYDTRRNKPVAMWVIIPYQFKLQ
jgi:TonB family protein